MLRILAVISWTALLIPFSIATAQDDLPRRLRQGIEAAIEAEGFGNATWGIEIRDLENGELLYGRNATKAFVPASTTKLATTSAALEWLGPAHRLETTLYAGGPIENGVLRGNLVIRGGGDPTIAERLEEFGYAGLLEQWADSVAAAGITLVEGDVIGDDDVFDDDDYGPGWQIDDLPYYYSVPVSGLSYNENVIHFEIKGERLGSPGIVSWEPPTSFANVRNQTVTISRDSIIAESYRRDPDDTDFVLASRVPVGRTDREALAVANPTHYFAHVFLETLEAKGVEVRGKAVDVDDLPSPPDYNDRGMRRLALHRSPPIARIAALINKPSHNLAAESLLKTLGRIPPSADAIPQPGSWKRGSRLVASTMARAGIDTSAVRLMDGSGLSRLNLMTPHAFAQLLGYMWNHDDEAVRDAFVASLAEGGGEGTLSSRFAAGPGAGRVRARTGTMTSVSALAGYLMRDGKSPIVFVLVCNNYTVPTRRVRAAQDEIVNLLARLSL